MNEYSLLKAFNSSFERLSATLTWKTTRSLEAGRAAAKSRPYSEDFFFFLTGDSSYNIHNDERDTGAGHESLCRRIYTKISITQPLEVISLVAKNE
jgi:hypothetical protein